MPFIWYKIAADFTKSVRSGKPTGISKTKPIDWQEIFWNYKFSVLRVFSISYTRMYLVPQARPSEFHLFERWVSSHSPHAHVSPVRHRSTGRRHRICGSQWKKVPFSEAYKPLCLWIECFPMTKRGACLDFEYHSLARFQMNFWVWYIGVDTGKYWRV